MGTDTFRGIPIKWVDDLGTTPSPSTVFAWSPTRVMSSPRARVSMLKTPRADESMEARATRIIAKADDALALRLLKFLGIHKDVMREIHLFGEDA